MAKEVGDLHLAYSTGTQGVAGVNPDLDKYLKQLESGRGEGREAHGSVGEGGSHTPLPVNKQRAWSGVYVFVCGWGRRETSTSGWTALELEE